MYLCGCKQNTTIIMERSIRYPIGIQTFRKIVADKYLYVDKTALVYDIVDKYDYVFLSRPRRFGKSLLLSTIESYLKGERELFKGLAIDTLEKEWKPYPVFRLDFSGNNYNNPERLVEHIESYLNEFEKAYSLNTEGNIATCDLSVGFANRAFVFMLMPA